MCAHRHWNVNVKLPWLFNLKNSGVRSGIRVKLWKCGTQNWSFSASIVTSCWLALHHHVQYDLHKNTIIFPLYKLSHSSHTDTQTHRWRLTSQRSNCWSQQSVDGQQGGVEQNSSQDEEGGPQSATGKDLTNTKRDATHYLDKRQKLEEDFYTMKLIANDYTHVLYIQVQEPKHTHKNIKTKCVESIQPPSKSAILFFAQLNTRTRTCRHTYAAFPTVSEKWRVSMATWWMHLPVADIYKS